MCKEVHFRPTVKKCLKRDIFHHKPDYFGRLELVIGSRVSIQCCASPLKLLDVHSHGRRQCMSPGPWFLSCRDERVGSYRGDVPELIWRRDSVLKSVSLVLCPSEHWLWLPSFPFLQSPWTTQKHDSSRMTFQRRNLMVLAREKWHAELCLAVFCEMNVPFTSISLGPTQKCGNERSMNVGVHAGPTPYIVCLQHLWSRSPYWRVVKSLAKSELWPYSFLFFRTM